MSHNVYHAIYRENVNKQSVQNEWDEVAAHEDWQEGCAGLPKNIRWIDTVCMSKDDAYTFIQNHDSGSYDQIAVKFRELPQEISSSLKTRLEKQIADYENKIVAYDKEHSIQNQKAAFISCPKCSSKLSRVHLRNNGCPVCGMRDIRAEYISEQLKSYRAKIAKWKAELIDENKKLTEKNLKRSKIYWLVKVEFHT